MDSEETTAIEKYIVENYTEPGLVKIMSVHATPLPTGENFLSLIWRISMIVLIEGKELEERFLVFKKIPKDEARQKMIIQTNIFRREIQIYQFVLKNMGSLIAEHEVPIERLWCDFISHNNYETLILQDLKPLGYNPGDKVKGLSLDEARLVFEEVGRYHALSKVTLKRGTVRLSNLSLPQTLSDPKFSEIYVVRCICLLGRAVKESWGPQWRDLADKLDQPAEFLIKKMIDTCAMNESRFNTVLHGDLWTSNILIKKGDLGEPKTVKFIDFQLSSYNSVGIDLTYLAYTSLRHDMRKTYFKHLLKVYSDSLQRNLKEYGYPTNDIPTYEYILNELKRLRFYALVSIALYYAIILTGITGKKEDAMLLMSENCSIPSRTPDIFKSQLFKDLVAEDIFYLVNNGAMD